MHTLATVPSFVFLSYDKTVLSLILGLLLETDLQWGKTFSTYLRSQHHRFPSWVFQETHSGLQKDRQ